MPKKSSKQPGKAKSRPGKSVAVAPAAAPGGRPSLYSRDCVERAYRLCLLGLTNEQLAPHFGVDVRTVQRWSEEHPEFCQALKQGREEADTKVAESLYKRALGYSHDSVKIFNNEGVPLVVPFVEHYPPDVAACIFWLKNRHSDKWRDKLAEFNVTQNVQNVQLPEGFMQKVRQYAQARYSTCSRPKEKLEG